MSGVLTSNKLIRSIKRRAMLPDGDKTFDTQDYLDILNEELQYFVIPTLLRTHEEYLLVSQDFTLDGSTRKFEIPFRASGNKLRELSYVTNVSGLSAGEDNEQVFELSRISVEDLPDYNNYFSSNYTETFYLENNKVVLLGEFPLTDAKLRMHYYLRPNTLVKEDRVGKITDINTTSGVITVEEFPDAFSSVPKMDFIKFQSPNTIMAFDITPSSVDSNTKTVTFTASDLPSDLQVGDYLNVAQETIVPQVPVEMHAMLAQRAAVAALEALGDTEGAAVAQKKLELMNKSVTDLIENRVEGAPEKIQNRHGPLKQAVFRSNRQRGKF